MAAFAGNHRLREADLRFTASSFKRLPSAVLQIIRFEFCKTSPIAVVLKLNVDVDY